LTEAGVLSRLRHRINVHAINAVEIACDAAKNARNVEERGLSFELVQAFDFQSALFVVDCRKEYGEVRYRGLGLVGERVHALVFTETPKGIRVISFRKANRREVKSYEQAQEQRST